MNEVIKEIIENLSVIYEKIYNEVYKSDIDDDYLILKSLYNKIDKYNILFRNNPIALKQLRYFNFVEKIIVYSIINSHY